MEPFLETSLCSRPDTLELHSPDRKGVEDGIGVTGGLKRQRALLSDDEETSLPIPKSQEGSKRRCLQPVGDENIDPLHRCPGSPERSRLRHLEEEVKPDTPAVSSIRTRLQWLAQKQGDGAVPQRCLSDPVQGEPTCSSELQSMGNVEFRSRVERFELPPPRSPALSTPRSQALSNLARSVQQKLQSADTPSSLRASRIRQERQEELRLLRSQPIAENAWMKRTLSDPSLAEVEASENSAGNDEQPGPTCSGNPTCLLEPSKELQSTAGEQEGPVCPTGKHFLPAEMLSSGEQLEQKVPSEERQKVPAEMLEESACFFGKQELEFLPSDMMEFAEGQQQAGLESPGGQEQRGEERQPPCVAEEQVEGEEEQGGEERQPPCVEEEQGEEERRPPCLGMKLVEGEEEQGGKEQQSSSVEEEQGEEEQQLAGEEEEQPACVEEQGQTKEALSVEEQGQVEDPGVEEQNVLRTVLRGQKKVMSVQESKILSGVSEMKEALSGKDLSQEEMSTSGMIDQLFAGVLDTEEEEEYKRRKEHCDLDAAEGKGEEMGLVAEGVELESRSLDSSADELLTLPPSCILSPLSKSVEAVVTPLRLASSCLPVTSVDCVPEGPHNPPPSSIPLYSIDAYRTQRQNSQHAVHIVTPTTSGRTLPAACPQPLINIKDRIKALSEEAVKLQAVITQTLQALSCCTDEDHGKGSLVEAEAEKLLLVSCEKRTALLAEVAQMRAGVESGDAVTASPSQDPCRGTVTITNIQLPLKVDFVCSSLILAGRPTHYFFVLIRYGACNIVATPLATAADAQTGDSISFPTSVTLQDIRSSFEIDVEVYSLSQTPGNTKNFNAERFSTKSKVTPKKFLSSIKRANHNAASATLISVGPQRSSNFCLVGSHKLTLASLGQTKFPLDKMKFDGKVRKLLGDEFQEKVPFLSPLEGNIYLQLNCESHSNVQHKGFLTMFEDVCGFGSWQRRWFSLEGNLLLYWSYPSSDRSKPPEGSINLASRAYKCVRLVTKDSCARPHTFELVSSKALQEDNGVTLDKCWFSADMPEERAEWMDKLNQALLDLHTWTCCPGGPEPPRPCRESLL